MNFDLDELIERFFSKDFMEENKDKFSEVIKHIQSCTNEFNYNVDGIGIDDVLEKSNDNSFKLNNTIRLDDNGIHVLYNFKDFWPLVEKNIPRSIKRLSIPFYGAEKDLNFLSEMPNLEEIEINDYGMFNDEELKFISTHTNVKRIICNSVFALRDNPSAVYSNNVAIYDDIVIKRKNIEDELKSENDIDIFANQLSSNQLKLLLNEYKNVKKISIGDSKSFISNNRCDVIFNGNDIEIRIADENIDKAIDYYQMFSSLGYNVKSITISIEHKVENEDKVIKYTEHDYTKLDELSKKVDLRIGYDRSFVTTSSYDEFKGLVESMKWYKKIITDYDLSPLEKLTFAYDIMKTFMYNESEKDKGDSRHPNRIIETGNIVCVGYTEMLNEILKDLDPNIIISSFGCSCYKEDDEELKGYHSRSMVRIDDNKYNIHGIYALDSTWDSYKSNGREVFGEDYDALSLYKYFMVPFTEYGVYFPHDTKPKFFSGKLVSLNEELTSDRIKQEVERMNKNEIRVEGELPQGEDSNKVFDSYYTNKMVDNSKKPQDELKEFDSRRLTFEEFLEVVKNVRIAEGYNGKELEEEMDKIARINSRYYGKEYVKDEGIVLG